MTDSISLEPIGVVRTPFTQQAGTPIQPRFAEGAAGTVEVFEPYAEALADVGGFERIWLLVLLDRARAWQPTVVPYLDTVRRGLFATRAPSRPNPIGLSVVEVVSVDGNRIEVRGVDLLDGTPLLDVKPYVPKFDAFPDSRAGWLDALEGKKRTADGRFADGKT